MSDLIKEKLNIELKREGRRATANLRRVRYCLNIRESIPGVHAGLFNTVRDPLLPLTPENVWEEGYFHMFLPGQPPMVVIERDDGFVLYTYAAQIQFLS